MGSLWATGTTLIGSHPFAFTTARDAADGLLFGWDIATLQNSALIYLGLSSLAFVLVWVLGYLRSR